MFASIDLKDVNMDFSVTEKLNKLLEDKILESAAKKDQMLFEEDIYDGVQPEENLDIPDYDDLKLHIVQDSGTIKDLVEKSKGSKMRFDQLCGKMKSDPAHLFYNILVMAQQEELSITQKKMCDDIIIKSF